jgi:alpha-glucoside transport system substrate-binding protein
MKNFKILSFFATAAMVLAACGGAAPSPTAAPAAPAAAPTEAPKPTEAPAAPTEAPKPTEAPAAAPTEAPKPTEAPAAAPSGSPGQEYEDALAGKLKGTKVSVFGPFGDQDEVKFLNTIKEFEEKTGIDIVYEGTKEFEAAINVRVEAGNASDIVDFPQPGLAARFAKSGKIIDARKMVNPEWLSANYNQSLNDILTVSGPGGEKVQAGIWERINGKSLVWFPKKAWDEAGYKVPTTWDELKALEQQIVKDGDAPWCIGIESGAATGWPATDWMEEIMLRTTSLENYDKWVAGELKFSDPVVKNAANEMARIWFDDALVFGGRKSIASTGFGVAPNPMFDKDGPKCWLHKQGNFITSFFPADAKPGVDYDFFYLPGIDPQYGKPFLFAGDLMAAFNDRPEVRAVMQFFTKGDHLKGWMAAGGAIAPQKDADLSWYTNDIERKVAQFVQEASSLRFDGSDLMPGEVGAGSFWKGMADWVSGVADLDKAMSEIDAAWPK